MMMPSCTRMMLLYLPMSSSTSVFVTMRPPAASESMSMSSRRSSPCWRIWAMRPVSICLRRTMQKTGGSGGFSRFFSSRWADGFCELMEMCSRKFCPGWRTDRMMDCLLGCVILSMRPPASAASSSRVSGRIEKPSRLIWIPHSFYIIVSGILYHLCRGNSSTDVRKGVASGGQNQ